MYCVMLLVRHKSFSQQQVVVQSVSTFLIFFSGSLSIVIMTKKIIRQNVQKEWIF